MSRNTADRRAFASSYLLWKKSTLFYSRYEKSASALVAIQKALKKKQPLGKSEREFLEVYSAVAAADPEIFTRVWVDPSAYWWIRVAYQLVGTCFTGAPSPPLVQAYRKALGGLKAREALALHLNSFKRFALAVNYLSGRNCLFRNPLDVDLPLAIPGTRLSLDGEKRIRILGLVDGCLAIAHGRETLTLPLRPGASVPDVGLTVSECPRVRYSGCEFRLQPAIFNVPGLEYVRAAAEAGLEYQAEHSGLLQETLKLIKRNDPATFQQIRKIVRYISLKPLFLGGYTNLSHSALPGALVVGVVNDPYELADTVIHEFHHDRLFFIEETGPFFDDLRQESVTADSYYSPWRNDLRPLHGVFHAVYVSIPVCRYWMRVYRNRGISKTRFDYALDRILRGSMQLAVGIYQLERYATFTAFGRGLFEALKKDVGKIQRWIRRERLAPDAPAMRCREDGSIRPELEKASRCPLTVRKAVVAHVRSFDRKHQVGPFLNQLGIG